jgi:hypothetical protein
VSIRLGAGGGERPDYSPGRRHIEPRGFNLSLMVRPSTIAACAGGILGARAARSTVGLARRVQRRHCGMGRVVVQREGRPKLTARPTSTTVRTSATRCRREQAGPAGGRRGARRRLRCRGRGAAGGARLQEARRRLHPRGAHPAQRRGRRALPPRPAHHRRRRLRRGAPGRSTGLLGRRGPPQRPADGPRRAGTGPGGAGGSAPGPGRRPAGPDRRGRGRSAPVCYGDAGEALPTTAADIAGWVADHYREHIPHVHELLRAWQASAPPAAPSPDRRSRARLQGAPGPTSTVAAQRSRGGASRSHARRRTSSSR